MHKAVTSGITIPIACHSARMEVLPEVIAVLALNLLSDGINEMLERRN